MQKSSEIFQISVLLPGKILIIKESSLLEFLKMKKVYLTVNLLRKIKKMTLLFKESA